MGDLRAVLTLQQEQRFRALTGVGAAPLEVVLRGWNKYVVLAPDRVFLVPRAEPNVEWFERELAVYDSIRLPEVPRLVDRWADPAVSRYPFAAVTRLPGSPPRGWTVPLAAALGRVIARWHQAPAPPLVQDGGRPPAHQHTAHHAWLRRALDPATSGSAADEAAARFDLPGAALRELLAGAAALRPVLVHGDVHEDQLLVEGPALRGVIDWETARVDHPFVDFDLGEWGTGAWRAGRHELDHVWHAMWSAYAGERGVDADHRAVAVVFRLRLAWWASAEPRAPAVAGSVREHRAAVVRLLARDGSDG